MSSVSSLYRRYILVCSQWSVDTTKSGRDFAVYIRKKIPELFPNGELSHISVNDIKNYEKQIESLERINKNVYFDAFKSFRVSSASGADAVECKQIISTESMKQINDLIDSGILERIKLRFGTIRFTKEKPIEQKTDN